jgi:hypothetical protein
LFTMPESERKRYFLRSLSYWSDKTPGIQHEPFENDNAFLNGCTHAFHFFSLPLKNNFAGFS